MIIIHPRSDGCHAQNPPYSYLFNQNLYNLTGIFLQNGDNKAKHIHEEAVTTQPQLNRKSHIPKDSVFFEKIVPLALIVMGTITLGLILFAAGVLLGIIQF